MTTRDDIKEEIEKEEKMSSGDGTIGSGDVDPDADNDVDEMMESVIGHKPHGKTLADEIGETEHNREKPGRKKRS